MIKNIYIANDHTSVEAKNIIAEYFQNKYRIYNLGTDETKSCNYAFYAQKLSLALLKDLDDSIGILLCATGEGMSIASNKINGIRCALVYNNDVASLAKRHNNANVIAFGTKQIPIDQIIEMIEIFLASEFEGGRHQIRLDSIE